jgi:cyclophilin family peptidyl-prolyl cis-trans isomerase
MKSIISTWALLFIALSLFSQSGFPEKGTRAIIETNFGNIEILLYDETPLHRDNFIKLAKDEIYKDLLFHRVIKNFMVQGGDPNSRNATKGELLGSSSSGVDIPAEINPKFYHKKGAIAAARKSDQVNPVRASSGSQFYIVIGNVISVEQLNQIASRANSNPFSEKQIHDYTTIGGTPHLDGAYTVFGEVISGIEIIEKIALMPVDSYNRPLEDVKFSVIIMGNK